MISSPSPRPSPRSLLAGRGRHNVRCGYQDAEPVGHPYIRLHSAAIRQDCARGQTILAAQMNTIVSCDTCGQVQQVDPVPRGFIARCARCEFQLFRHRPNSRRRTLAFSLAALILYFPSNIYPVVTAEYHGMHSETTVFEGIKSLYLHQQFFIGTLVLFTSILTPALKIMGLLMITLTLDWRSSARPGPGLTKSSTSLIRGTCWKCFCWRSRCR